MTTENDFQTPDAAPDPAPGPWSARPVPPPATHSWRDIRDDLADWARTLFSAGVYAVLIITFVGQVARVEGSSMEPTLHDQDRLVVNKIAYLLHDPTIGDIVMHYYPKDPDLTFVKRIIAGPGDMVEIKGGQVYRNGEMVKDDYVDDNMRSHEDEPAQFVSDGHYFVMGDHRNNSLDSRAWGLLPAKYILGKVELRWWPLDRAKIFAP